MRKTGQTTPTVTTPLTTEQKEVLNHAISIDKSSGDLQTLAEGGNTGNNNAKFPDDTRMLVRNLKTQSVRYVAALQSRQPPTVLQPIFDLMVRYCNDLITRQYFPSKYGLIRDIRQRLLMIWKQNSLDNPTTTPTLPAAISNPV